MTLDPMGDAGQVYILKPMTQEDVEEVSRVERQCFTNPWPVSAYRRELKNPRQNFYIVLRDDPNAVDAEAPVSTAALDGASRASRRPRRWAFWPLGQRDVQGTPPPIIGFAGM